MEWTKLQNLQHLHTNEIALEDYEHLTPLEAFEKFYKATNHADFQSWLDEIINESPKKLNTKAETLRNHGNKLYATGHTKEAIDFYSKSLKFATFNEADYGKALANRSAALFSLGKYEECLKDIENCYVSKYPEELKTKIHLRKILSFYHLNMSEEFFIEVDRHRESLKDNEMFKELITNFKGNVKLPVGKCIEDCLTDYGCMEINTKFAYATNLIELCFSEEKGRHVLAACDIKQGEILFKEKAFIVSTIFKSEDELIENICYYCLKHIPYSNIPCESCTYCIYCNEKCKKASWTFGHRFECPGMNIWYEVGQGLPAYKFLMKGIHSNFHEATNEICDFGGYIDNYPFANILLSHFEERKDKIHLIFIAAITVIYLKEKTDFFAYLQERIHIENDKCLEIVIGGRLVKHMSQLFCNGSIIEQTGMKKPIAAAIFPSIGMMNHSCKPNISIEYDGSVAIIKAKEEIPKGGEIFNNYGVDWKTSKDIRQEYLRDNFCFDCLCEICLKEK